MNRDSTLLMQALMATGLVQPVELDGRGGRLSAMCRQVPGQEGSWLRVVDQLLEAVPELHVCRRYVRKDGRMVFGWFLEISTKKAKDLSGILNTVIDVLKTARPALQSATPKPSRPRPQPVQQEEAQTPPPTAASHSRAVMKDASPKPPPAPAGAPPPSLRVVRDGVDPKGNKVTILEMPLPHVFEDLNEPTKPVWNAKLGRWVGGGKGASYIGEG